METEPTAATPPRQKVLVLSDNEGVARTIELALGRELKVVKFVTTWPCQPDGQPEKNGYALIVIALSSYASEPVVALARTSLGYLLGQVPLLIISEKRFQTDPYTRIVHMDFPFVIDRLSDQVRRILRGEIPKTRAPQAQVDGG